MYAVHTSFHLSSYRSTAKPLSVSQSAAIKSNVMVSPLDYIGTAGHVSAEVIEKYIQGQQMKLKRNSCSSVINLQ